MNLKKAVGIAIIALALNASVFGTANAASVDVKCEVGAKFSKISINGIGMPSGYYRALANSPKLSSKPAMWSNTPLKSPVLGEVGFVMSSDKADVKAGATHIPPNFIINNVAVGSLYRYNRINKTYTFVGSVKATCLIK
ncbi:MAG: hypothetical protein HOP36_01370 [Methyloglobulus sp.]|nr:hypothetical protein [Methyloglobulus sp.]